MARAFKCDICSHYYDPYNTKQSAVNFNGFIPINVDENGKYFENKMRHVCPTCKDEMCHLFEKLGRKVVDEKESK